MNIQFKSFAIGFVLGCLVPVLAFFGLMYIEGVGDNPVFRDQALSSGTHVKVTSFNLVWGVEHKDRNKGVDQLALEYVSSFTNGDEQGRERELLEVFELIRPASEQWGFDHAQVAAFPTIKRKGKYDLYLFDRTSEGKWAFTRKQMKVFVND